MIINKELLLSYQNFKEWGLYMRKILGSIIAIVIASNIFITVDHMKHNEIVSAIILPAGDDLIEGEY